jgi:hypothetical protein
MAESDRLRHGQDRVCGMVRRARVVAGYTFVVCTSFREACSRFRAIPEYFWEAAERFREIAEYFRVIGSTLILEARESGGVEALER